MLPQVNRKPKFNKADFLGHLISGACLLLAFLLLIVYVALIYVSLKCKYTSENFLSRRKNHHQNAKYSTEGSHKCSKALKFYQKRNADILENYVVVISPFLLQD